MRHAARDEGRYINRPYHNEFDLFMVGVKDQFPATQIFARFNTGLGQNGQSFFSRRPLESAIISG